MTWSLRSRPVGPAATTVVASAVLAIAVAGCGANKAANAANGSSTVAQVAMYQGSDREQKLEAGAKKEGAFVLYTSNTATEAAGKEFGKMHPELKVTTYLAQANDLLNRLKQETAANKVGGDVLGVSDSDIPQAEAAGFLQEFYSPTVNEQPADTVKAGKTKGDVVYAADRESYTIMGFNTKLVNKADVPTTLDGLLDPRWKGKMAISNHTTGVNWVGVVDDAKGDGFFKQLAAQQIQAQDVTAAALTDLVASGQIAMSPNLGLSDVILARSKGAPIDWVPIEPVPAANGSDGLLAKAKHPNAALLFLDYLHSKDGQQFMVSKGNISPRTDVPAPGVGEITFKSVDVSQQYDAAQYADKYAKWQALLNQTFVKK